MKLTTAPGTLVLVTDQFACERIIKSARTIAGLHMTELLVLSVMHAREQTNPAALEHLFGVAKEYGAVMTVAFSDNPYDAIMGFAREHRVVNVVTGVPSDAGSMLVKMWQNQPGLNFFTVSQEGELREVLDRQYRSPQQEREMTRYIENELCLQER